MSDKITAALLRFHKARLARNAARKAMSRYLARSWGEIEPDEEGPGYKDPKAHKYGACNLGYDHDKCTPYEAVYLLCDVCKGSEPFYLEMRRASRMHGAALRALQALGKSIAETSP